MPWSYAGPTRAALSSFDFVYTGLSGQSGVCDSAVLSWEGTFGYNHIQVTATANYQNGSTTVALPDLSNLSGFVSALPSGTQVLGAASIAQSSAETQPVSANGTLTAVENAGTY